jgi:hypothetical protein
MRPSRVPRRMLFFASKSTMSATRHLSRGRPVEKSSETNRHDRGSSSYAVLRADNLSVASTRMDVSCGFRRIGATVLSGVQQAGAAGNSKN